MKKHLHWSGRRLSLAPHLWWRNGNPDVDIDLFGYAITPDKPALVRKAEYHRFGQAAPCLPVAPLRGGYLDATPPELYGPYLQCPKLARISEEESWFYRLYVIHKNGIYTGRIWVEPWEDISAILAVQAITLPRLVHHLKQQRQHLYANVSLEMLLSPLDMVPV